MVFSSFAFLFWFLPFCLIVYLLARKNTKNLVLLFFSIVFYYHGAVSFGVKDSQRVYLLSA